MEKLHQLLADAIEAQKKHQEEMRVLVQNQLMLQQQLHSVQQDIANKRDILIAFESRITAYSDLLTEE